MKRMKKFVLNALAAILLLMCFAACRGNVNVEEKFYTVEFVPEENAQVLNDVPLLQTVKEGESIQIPELFREFYGYQWDKEILADDVREDAVYTAQWAMLECKLPVLKINMADDLGEITSKVEYRSCRVQLIYPENAAYEFDITAELRGRGNSTWGTPKNPYRLRFPKANPIGILGSDYEARSWTLLANYFDRTLLRNAIVFDFARQLSGLTFTPMAKFAELYFNDDYRGIYMISDQVSDLAVTGKRVPVENPSKTETEPDFLLELDCRLPEDETEIYGETWFWSEYGRPFAIKTDATAAQFQYIVNETNRLEGIILNGSFLQVQQAIDIPSFIDFFLLCELFKNPDVAFSSAYCYKTKNGKLTMTPVWDFDICGGNGLCGEGWAHDITTSGLYAQTTHWWFQRLMTLPQFKAQYVARWNELYEQKIPGMIDRISVYGAYMADYFGKDQAKWETLQKSLSNPTADAIGTYQGQIDYFQNFMKERAEWLNQYYTYN